MNNKAILFFLLITLFSPISQALNIELLRAIITPKQIDMLIQKYQPSMQPSQRNRLSQLVQQHIDNLSPQELAQLANAKISDIPDLVQQHISRMPPEEMKQIKQTLKIQKSPQQ
ncbi:MAG: hypothetical protein NTW85_04535 [Methylococcales bacterium]|nr:hypothetical protein [Methylococcales bacterium]